MYKGIFWLVKDRAGNESLLVVKVACDEQGQALEDVCFSSKSGRNFNHQAEWARLPVKLKQGKPYNYYPRGRVEIRKGKVKVYCHPIFVQDPYHDMVIEEFLLPKVCRFIADHSSHYEARGDLP